MIEDQIAGDGPRSLAARRAAAVVFPASVINSGFIDWASNDGLHATGVFSERDACA